MQRRDDALEEKVVPLPRLQQCGEIAPNRGLTCLFGLVVFLLIFGPKFGLFDVSAAGGLLGLALVLPSQSPRFPRKLHAVTLVMALVLVYSVGVYLLAGFPDTYFLLRAARAFLATLLIAITVNNARLRVSVMLDVVIDVLLLHAIAVLVQILIPEVKPVFAHLWGFDKTLSASVRGFGLTAGYDIAGFLCVAGMVLSLLSGSRRARPSKYFARALVFCAAGFFTSRISMVVTVVTAACFGLRYLFVRRARRWRLVGIAALVGIGMAALYYVFPLVLSTISIGDANASFDDLASRYTPLYSQSSIRQLLGAAWIVPTSTSSLLFGSGVNPPSDIGYIKLLNMIGMTGLVLVIGLYCLMLRRTLRSLRMRELWAASSPSRVPAGEDVAVRALSILLPLQFALNFKNLLFLTRSAYELTLLLLAIVVLGTDIGRADASEGCRQGTTDPRSAGTTSLQPPPRPESTPTPEPHPVSLDTGLGSLLPGETNERGGEGGV